MPLKPSTYHSRWMATKRHRKGLNLHEIKPVDACQSYRYCSVEFSRGVGKSKGENLGLWRQKFLVRNAGRIFSSVSETTLVACFLRSLDVRNQAFFVLVTFSNFDGFIKPISKSVYGFESFENSSIKLVEGMLVVGWTTKEAHADRIEGLRRIMLGFSVRP